MQKVLYLCMRLDQMLLDYPELTIKNISEVTTIHRNTLSSIKRNKFTGKIPLLFFLKMKQTYPYIDLKVYFPEYKELIKLEVDER